MAFLNYGRKRGLAYKHDFKSWNDEMNRQEQLNMAKKAENQQKAMWLAERMKLGKTWTNFDTKGLQNFAKTQFEEINKITREPEWETNPEALSMINMIGERLQNNEFTNNSALVKTQLEQLIQASANPEYAEDDEARMQLEQMWDQFNNYDKFGNTDGIEGGEVRPFIFSAPVTFDPNQYFNTQAKEGAGIETVAFDDGVRYGTRKVVKNMPDLIRTAFSGKDGNRLMRAYQKYKATGGNLNSPEEWFTYNINQRVDTGLNSYQIRSSSDGNGNGEDSNIYAPFEMQIKSQLQEAMQLSQMKGNEGKQFTVNTSNAWAFAPGFTGVDANSNVGSLRVPTNGLKVYNDDGTKFVNLTAYSNQTKDVSMDNAIVYVNGEPHVTGRMRFKAEQDKEFTQKILKDDEFFFLPTDPEDYIAKEGYGNTITPAKNKNGDIIKGEFDVSFLVPANFSYENIRRYDGSYSSPDKANNVSLLRQQAAAQQSGARQQQLVEFAKSQGIKPGQKKTFVNKNGQKTTIQVNPDGTVVQL